MNIAYLVLVHDQPLHLVRLIERLDQPTVHFYIHFDKKSKHLPSAARLLSKYPNVTLISTYKVNWMGFSMIQSTLAIMQLAYSSGIDFKYFVLLSGQDYPIKKNKYINDFFASHSSDFISYNKISHMSPGIADKVRLFHFPEIEYTNPRSAKKIPLLVKLYYGSYKRFKKYLPKRAFYNGLEPYFGSQWFALTHDTVAYILKFIAENRKYMGFMKYTEGPDEIFFQTIILNSERKNNLYDYARYLDWLKTRKEGELFIHGYSSLRYMDWSERGKPKPAVLDNSYYETLEASDELFARKFDEKKSATLLDQIDRHLLTNKTD